MPDIKLTRYLTINACLAAFFQCGEEDLNTLKGKWEWIDADGEFNSVEVQESLKMIRRKRVWGWIEKKKMIHFFARKDATVKNIINMFAHEIGHSWKPWYRSVYEEKKANKYSTTAIQAYELAIKVKGVING
jgi:hypothetical protein